MWRVVWTEPAQADVMRIRRYIARFRPRAAQRMTEALYAAAQSLGAYPERGKPTKRGQRELLIVQPYRLVYRIAGEEVFIMRVLHTARRQGFAEETPDIFDVFDDARGDLGRPHAAGGGPADGQAQREGGTYLEHPSEWC